MPRCPTVLTYGHGDVVDGMVRRVARQSRSLADHDQGRARLWPRHRRQQEASTASTSAALAAVARGARRQARLQRQIHHRDRRGDRLARSAAGVRGPPRGAEGRSVPGLRRAAACRPSGRPFSSAAAAATRIHLDVNLRDGGHHSGNWGGVLANPATILAERHRVASSTARDGCKLERLKPPRISNAVRAALADVKVEPTADEPAALARLGRGGAVAGRAALCLEYAGSAGDVVGQYRQARQRYSRHSATPCCSSASSSAPDMRRSSTPCARSARNGFPMVEVSGHAALCGLAHRCRQPLGQLDRGIDPADHRQGAGDPAEFRRLAAERRVLRRARACRRSGCRIPIPAARSMRRTSTSCCR